MINKFHRGCVDFFFARQILYFDTQFIERVRMNSSSTSDLNFLKAPKNSHNIKTRILSKYSSNVVQFFTVGALSHSPRNCEMKSLPDLKSNPYSNLRSLPHHKKIPYSYSIPYPLNLKSRELISMVGGRVVK